MMSTARVVTGDYVHTRRLKSMSEIGGLRMEYPSIKPVYEAFDAMIESQRYDVCELAIGAYLQAWDAGKPISLLPVVMAGHYQYENLYAAPGRELRSPADLAGGRIGIRSYSQTTGLWVRGWLEESFGVAPDSVTWVVTERSHSEHFEDPPNVELIDGSLADALVDGEIDAAILGFRYVPEGSVQVVPDWAERDAAWVEEHGFAPVNHLLSVSDAFRDDHPDVVATIYETIASDIAELGTQIPFSGPPQLPNPVRVGLDAVRGAVALAAEYAYRQGLIGKRAPDVDRLFRG